MLGKYILPLLVVIGVSLAIHGTVYDIGLSPVPKAIISAYHNGSLVGRTVSNSTGKYTLYLPPGKYLLTAYSPDDSLASNDTLMIYSPNQTFDIILVEQIPYELPQNFSIPSFGEIQEEQPYTPSVLSRTDYILIVFGIGLLLIGLYIGLFVSLRKRYKPKDKDAELVLNIIKENGGQIFQGKIVERTGWSEAKVSLVLSSLKKSGLIKKKRLGRKKVVYLVSNDSR